MFPEVAGLELPPETLLEHNYQRRERSAFAPQPLRPTPNSIQSVNFFPDTQTDLEREDDQFFYSNSDRPGVERPTRQLKFLASNPDYETLRDPRQLKFLYPNYKTVRISRPIKYRAFYPDYAIVRQRNPRQLKF